LQNRDIHKRSSAVRNGDGKAGIATWRRRGKAGQGLLARAEAFRGKPESRLLAQRSAPFIGCTRSAFGCCLRSKAGRWAFSIATIFYHMLYFSNFYAL
jgi:hypothetical protein